MLLWDPKRRKTGTARYSRWDAMYDLLVDYGRENGSCNVPLSCKVKDETGEVRNLGTWLGTQRQYFKKGLLAESYCQRLQSLADKGLLVWGDLQSKVDRNDRKWDFMFLLLLKFGDEYGHCNVPERYEVTVPKADNDEEEGAITQKECIRAIDNSRHGKPYDTHLLGKWLERQRKQWKAGTLRSDRAEKLQQLEQGGLLVKDTIAQDEQRWQDHYQALLRFQERHGHCNVPYNYVVSGNNGGEESDEDDELENAEEMVSEEDSGNSDSEQPCPHGKQRGSGAHSPAKVGRKRHADQLDQPAAAVHRTLKLGAWLNNQRHARHGQRARLRPDRLALLQALVDAGQLRWSAGLLTKQQKWDETYAALLKHCEGRVWLGSEADTMSASGGMSSGCRGSWGATVTGGGGGDSSAKLLPFAGSVELSDSSQVEFFPWLQKQLALMPHGVGGGDGGGLWASSGSGGSAGARKKTLTPEHAQKIRVLLEKGVGVFRWAQNVV